MQNISVYLNQLASNSDNDWKSEINSALFRSNIDFKSPSNINDLYTNLDLDIENNVDAVMSVGGDGTVNTIIQKLAGTDVGLLVVPGGTANDLAHTLGSSQNIKKISQTIRQNTRKKIDLISINGKFMATNGGIGFAAFVAEEINLLRKDFPKFKNFMKVSGKSIYSIFLAKRLLTMNINSYKFKIQADNYQEITYSSLILINNQPVLGGSFNVAPNTVHNDGTFNLTILKHRNRLELIQCLVKIFNNEFPHDDKNLISIETKEANIELLDSNENLSFFGDGEILNTTNKWNIKLYRDFLTVFSPKDQVNLGNNSSKVSLM